MISCHENTRSEAEGTNYIMECNPGMNKSLRNARRSDLENSVTPHNVTVRAASALHAAPGSAREDHCHAVIRLDAFPKTAPSTLRDDRIGTVEHRTPKRMSNRGFPGGVLFTSLYFKRARKQSKGLSLRRGARCDAEEGSILISVPLDTVQSDARTSEPWKTLRMHACMPRPLTDASHVSSTDETQSAPRHVVR